MMTQIAERDMRRDYEEFKRETGELFRKQREAKEQRNIETSADMPRRAAESTDN